MKSDLIQPLVGIGVILIIAIGLSIALPIATIPIKFAAFISSLDFVPVSIQRFLIEYFLALALGIIGFVALVANEFKSRFG